MFLIYEGVQKRERDKEREAFSEKAKKCSFFVSIASKAIVLKAYKVLNVFNFFLFCLKVHSCRFENLPICSNSYKSTTLKVSYFYS